jgi:hypothetical protein
LVAVPAVSRVEPCRASGPIGTSIATSASAASGDADAVAQATQDVCEEIVKDTVPSGSAQDQALTACQSATQ